jgi:hypothetical protein
MHSTDDRTFCSLLNDHVERVAAVALDSKDPVESVELITPFLEVRHNCSRSGNYIRAFDLHCQLLARIAAEIHPRTRAMRTICGDILTLLLDINTGAFAEDCELRSIRGESSFPPELSYIVFDTILQIIAVAPSPINVLYLLVEAREGNPGFFEPYLAPFRAMRAEYLRLVTLRVAKSFGYRSQLRACVREIFLSCEAENSFDVHKHFEQLWGDSFSEILQQGERIHRNETCRRSINVMQPFASVFASTSNSVRRFVRRVPVSVKIS